MCLGDGKERARCLICICTAFGEVEILSVGTWHGTSDI